MRQQLLVQFLVQFKKEAESPIRFQQQFQNKLEPLDPATLKLDLEPGPLPAVIPKNLPTLACSSF